MEYARLETANPRARRRLVLLRRVLPRVQTIEGLAHEKRKFLGIERVPFVTETHVRDHRQLSK
jgi:hypothetical protein